MGLSWDHKKKRYIYIITPSLFIICFIITIDSLCHIILFQLFYFYFLNSFLVVC